MGSGGGQVRAGVAFLRANAVGELVGARSQDSSQHGETTGRQGPAIQLRCDGGAGSQENFTGPGSQRWQWPYESFKGPEDQGQGPEFIGYILR